MPDDYVDLNGPASDESEASGRKSNSSSGLERWAHFPAGFVFGLLLFVLRGHPWRWYIAIDGGYTVYVFWFAIGSVAQNFDDVLGDSKISKEAAKLLILHIPVLIALTGAT